MANLHNYHGRYCEAEFESNISFLFGGSGVELSGRKQPSRAVPCGTCYTLMTWSFS